ncbi:hypothetical protein Tco_1324224 [Tanacetum coccineum]
MSEKELRERLIGCSFLATINGCNANWQAVGLAQMRRWVANNNCKDYVKLLASEVKKIEKRCVAEEECSYCSAPVVFLDTEEVAYYQDDRCSKDGVTQKHKLERYPLTVDSKERVTIMHNGSSNGEILSKPFCPFCGVLLQRMQPDPIFFVQRHPNSSIKLQCDFMVFVLLGQALGHAESLNQFHVSHFALQKQPTIIPTSTAVYNSLIITESWVEGSAVPTGKCQPKCIGNPKKPP